MASSLLWCIVVDSLLLKLNALEYTAQAYTNELTIVIQGKHLNTVTDLTQGSLWVVDSWCKTKGLSINPEKTEALLFIGKKKTEEVVRLEYEGVKLNLTNEVKYVSIILDDNVESTHGGTSKEEAEGSVVVQCIYWQDLGTLAQDSTVAEQTCDNP